MIFDNFASHLGAPRVSFRDAVLKRGSQGGPRAKKTKTETHFSGRDPRRVTFGSILAANFEIGLFYVFFGDFCSDSKKAVNMELPKGGRCAIRQCLCMFREGRPLPLWLHFRLHFGVILGPKFATILLFGRPGAKQAPKREGKTNFKK